MKKISVKNRQFAYEVKGRISSTVVLETGIGAESGEEGISFSAMIPTVLSWQSTRRSEAGG